MVNPDKAGHDSLVGGTYKLGAVAGPVGGSSEAPVEVKCLGPAALLGQARRRHIARVGRARRSRGEP
jgi:hypothetical protein